MTKNISINCFRYTNSPSLNSNLVKPGSFIHISKLLARNKILGILDLSGNFVGNVGLNYISAGLTTNDTLISLSLSQTFINEDSISCLMDIINNTKIRYLNLSKNKLTNKFLDEFTRNKKTLRLYYLNLSQCCFSGNSCQKFFDELNQSSVKTLIFDGNEITSMNLMKFGFTLRKLIGINHLSLNSCKLTTEIVQSIANNLFNQSCLMVLHLQDNRINVILFYYYYSLKER